MRKVTFVCLILFGISVGKLWGYLVTPSNCLVDYGSKVIGATLDLGKCVYKNATFQEA